MVETTQQVTAQAKSDLMHGINSDGSSSISQYAGRPSRGRAKTLQSKKVVAKVRRICEVFSDSKSAVHRGKKKKK